MFGLFRKKASPTYVLPEGDRAYAIGDIHGRLDLLVDLLDAVERDDAASRPARTFVVFLGDLIDRGPDSRRVIEYLMHRDFGAARVVMLLGNHEESFLAALAGDRASLRNWLAFGGKACARSYGMDPDQLAVLSPDMITQELNRLVPAEHVAWLSSFYDSFALGGYLFVHAGIRPGIDFDAQDPADLRWIRREFLSSNAAHGAVVVHGHSIVEEAADLGNRIAIDTGAYRTGILTALRLEGGERAFITARGLPDDDDGFDA